MPDNRSAHFNQIIKLLAQVQSGTQQSAVSLERIEASFCEDYQMILARGAGADGQDESTIR